MNGKKEEYCKNVERKCLFYTGYWEIFANTLLLFLTPILK